MSMKYFNEKETNSTRKKIKIDDDVYLEIKKASSSLQFFLE